jgi:hypothetical protein
MTVLIVLKKVQYFEKYGPALMATEHCRAGGLKSLPMKSRE